VGFTSRAELDGLITIARARRPPDRLAEHILRLPRDPHSKFALPAPARASVARAGAPGRAPPEAARPARSEPSSSTMRRRALQRTAVATAVHATLSGRAAVAAIRFFASQHGVRLPNRARTTRVCARPL